MISWCIHIMGLLLTWQFTVLPSDSFFQGILCPLLFALFLIFSLCKLVFLFGPEHNAFRHSNHGGGGGYFGGGGDGGGGDGAC